MSALRKHLGVSSCVYGYIGEEDDSEEEDDSDSDYDARCDCCVELWDDCQCWCSNCGDDYSTCRAGCND